METIRIKGMSCNHCVAAVKKALSSIEGVTEVSVDLEKAEASVQRDADTPMRLLHEAIEKEGYQIG